MREKLLNGILKVIYGIVVSLTTLFTTDAHAELFNTPMNRCVVLEADRAVPIIESKSIDTTLINTSRVATRINPKLVITSPNTVQVGSVLTAAITITEGGDIGTIRYNITNGSGMAELANHNTGLITGVRIGTVTLTVTSSGNADYAPASTSQLITISKGTPTLTITSANTLGVNDNLIVKVVKSDKFDRGGSVRFLITGGNGLATVDPNTGLLKAISVGTITLTATSSGDAEYNPAVVNQEIIIHRGTPGLTITSAKTLSVDNTLTATVKTTATRGRGGAITFAISTNDGYAKVDPSTGLITGITAGAVTLTATSAGDSDYYPATTSQQIIITSTSPILTITSANVVNVDNLLKVRVKSSATDGLGGAFLYTVMNGSGSATIDAQKGLLTAISAGTVTLVVTSIGDSDYSPATTSQQITIYPGNPVLTITSSDTLAVDEKMMVKVSTTATGGRGGSLTFAISTEDGYATVNPNTGLITGITAGEVTLTVTSAGDSDYNRATASQRIVIMRTTPTLEIFASYVLNVDESVRIRVVSTATDGLGGEYSYVVSDSGSGSAMVDPDTGLLMAIHAGMVTLTVTSAGDSDYYPATASQQLRIVPRTPVLTITSSDTLRVHETLAVTATTDARDGQGGTITFIVSNGSGSAVIDPDTKLLVGVRAGTIMLVAISKGDTDYTMATTSQLITISDDATSARTKAKLFIADEVVDVDSKKVIIPQALSPNGDGVNDQFIIQNIESYPNNTVTITNRYGGVLFKAQRYDNNAIIFTGKSSNGGAELTGGTYFCTVEFCDQQGKSYRDKGFFKVKR